MNYIVTKSKSYFQNIGDYNYCSLQDMKLTKWLAVDTETTGLNPRDDDMFAIQLGTGEDNYLIDLQNFSTDLFQVEHYVFEDVIMYLKERILVLHNSIFDLGFFFKHNFYPEETYDTMIASMILYNGNMFERNSFGVCMERELNITYDKTVQKNIHKVRLSTRKAIHYCFNDVDRLLELHTVSVNKMRDRGDLKAYKLNCEYCHVLAYMERCGLPFNVPLWKEKMVGDLKESKLQQQGIIEYIYDNLPQYRNRQLDFFDTTKKVSCLLSSPKQMIPIFKDFEINVLDDEGKESINSKVINKSAHEFVEKWLKYKEAEHDVTTFGQNVLDKVINGRIYTRFNPIVDTCRISTRRGEINFLNFKGNQATRQCFRSEEGWDFIVCDYDNQETRVLAAYSNDPNAIENILAGRDSHCFFARAAFEELVDLSDKEIKDKHNDKRQIGKIIGFTVSFGGTGYTIARNLNMDPAKGEELYEVYTSLYPSVFTWGDDNYDKAIKVGYIETAYGFKLLLPKFDMFNRLNTKIKAYDKGFWDIYRAGKKEYKAYWKSVEDKKEDKNIQLYEIEDQESLDIYKEHRQDISSFFKLKGTYKRLCLNFKVQSTAAMQTKLAGVNYFKEIKKNGHIDKVKICNACHDEFNVETPTELTQQYNDLLGKVMQDSANAVISHPQIKMTCESHYGRSWYEAK